MKYSGDNSLDSFLNFLKKIRCQMTPCSTEEIEWLVQLTEYKYLPKNYIKFMQNAGNGIRFFEGSSYTIDEISLLKEAAIELLQENSSIENITDNNFVFFMHQGYQFYFFNLNEGDNPPIYFYTEGENQDRFVKAFESFSEFLINYYNDVEMLI